MATLVNFGIDLGTTNSLIAKFDKGQVEVFKNPNGFKETLPSVVGFRNDRIMVGEQARTYAERDPQSVASRFKRKMGTTEKFQIKSLKTSKSPVELSSLVLRELKAFVHSGEPVNAAVITIPASFDTVQSNATKEAGKLAGFDSVYLLQEPIAASLAYANKDQSVDLKNSQWIVYDLGGGTFDVALVRIVEGELTVVDHEGNNYLGGSDFDALMVEKIVVPELERRGKFQNLLGEMKSESGKYNRLWTVLLHKAEEAKVELSTKTSAEIDLGMIRDLKDDEGQAIDSVITITRSEFEAVIRDAIDTTSDMMKRILTRNTLQSNDIKFILMVGGATYTPYVRKRIEELMGIPINANIDPTNAIAIGAAYFAGAKELSAAADASGGQMQRGPLRIRMAYNRNSQELEEVLSLKVEGDTKGLSYRITREDGSFDSGLKKLAARVVEDLPLREGAYNFFKFVLLDDRGNVIDAGFEPIQIAQGKYSVAGQMLPDDLSLVKDDLSIGDTRLDRVFAKNTVLPANKKMTVEVGRTIVKNADEEIRIIVVEGSAENHSSANKPIGLLLVSGKQISRDLLKGTEIDLTFEMSESRDLTVSAYLNGTGQEFSQVFDPKPRAVTVKMLSTELLQLETKIQDETEDARSNSNSSGAEKLDGTLSRVQELLAQASTLSEDDVTDDRFKLEDRKRQIAQEVFQITSDKRLRLAKQEYEEAKSDISKLVAESGNDRERHQLVECLAREQSFIHSKNPERVRAGTSELFQIRARIMLRTPQFLRGMFEHLVEVRTTMNDQPQAADLIEKGRRAIVAENWDDLRQVNGRLWDLVPDLQRSSEDVRLYTGII